MKHAFTLGLVTLITVSCSSSSSSSESGYSSDMVLASPFSATASESIVVKGVRVFESTRAGRVDQLRDLLTATTIDACSFAIDLNRGDKYATCYGPKVDYVNHPFDDTSDGQLPTGDLGFWNSTTDNSTTEACTAGQINKLLDRFGSDAHYANLIGATLNCFARTSAALPGDGETVTLDTAGLTAMGFGTAGSSDALTVETASISGSNNSDGDLVLTYSVTGELYDHDAGKTYEFTVTTKHVDTTAGFDALISYAFYDSAPTTYGNCPSSGGLTYAGHLIINKNSESQVVEEYETAEFCGNSTPVNTTTLQIGMADDYEAGTNTDGWGNDYNYVLFSFDPRTTASTYLVGSYVYAWQAGEGDGLSRIFNATISSDGTTKTGAGYFGFGKKFYTADTEETDLGKIQGMVCNWAGPGGYISTPYSPSDYVQRQLMTYDATNDVWEMTSEDIKYAPHNSCTVPDPSTDSFTFNSKHSQTSAALEFSNDYTELYPSGYSSLSAADTRDLYDVSALKSGGFYIPFSTFPSRPSF